MFSYNCLAVVPISHLTGGSTGESTESAFIMYSRVGKWSA